MKSKQIGVSLLLSSLLISPAVFAQTDAASQIIDGTVANKGDWPFMTALVSEGKNAMSGQFCGASFIGGRYVLTAAHCVYDLDSQALDVVIGVHNLNNEATEGKRVAVREIYTHKNYPLTNGYDIAILELAEEVDAPAVTLANSALRNSLAPGESLTVMGWGNQSTIGRVFPTQLYQVNVPLVSQATCRSAGDANAAGYAAIGDDAFCAGFAVGGKDSCQGDSGGPIVVEENGEYQQLGVVSWGEGCAQANKYGVYANVSYFNDWIESKTLGLQYTQIDHIGVKAIQNHSHEFQLTNNSAQEINLTSITSTSAGVVIGDSSCNDTVAVGQTCIIPVSYDVAEEGEQRIKLDVTTDNPKLANIELGLLLTGANHATEALSEQFTIENTGVYSMATPWTIYGNGVQSGSIGDNEESVLALTGLPKGNLYADVRLSSELDFDGLFVFVNGQKVDFISGEVNAHITLDLLRESNTVLLAYRKDEMDQAGEDKVYITNITTTAPSGGSSSGGSVHWLALLLLGGFGMMRKQRR